MVISVSDDHCSKDALTGFLGWMLQGVLAGLAFTCLIGTLINYIFDSSLSLSPMLLITAKYTFQYSLIHRYQFEVVRQGRAYE